MYLCTKFQVSSIILTSFDGGRGGYFNPPTSKRTPKIPTQIRVKNLFLNMNVQVYTTKYAHHIRCIRYGIFKPDCDTTYDELLDSMNYFYSIHHLTLLNHDKPQPMLVKCNISRKDFNTCTMYIKKDLSVNRISDI